MTCVCCTAANPKRDPDPWESRLDAYCEDCAAARCDAFPGECGSSSSSLPSIPLEKCEKCGGTGFNDAPGMLPPAERGERAYVVPCSSCVSGFVPTEAAVVDAARALLAHERKRWPDMGLEYEEPSGYAAELARVSLLAVLRAGTNT